MIFTPEWLTALSTVVLVVATSIYVYFTYRLTQETTKLREIETTPFISMYIKPDYFLSLVIENIGKAPAYDIEFEMDKKYSQYFSCGCDFKHKISYFSPNQQLIISMDTFKNLEKLDFDYIPIKVKYYSKERKKFEYSFKIEWKYLSGSNIIQDNLKEIKKAIDNTTKELKGIYKSLEKKECFVTQKLRILEFTLIKNGVYIIFSNEFIITIAVDEFVKKTGIKDIQKVILNNGNLHDYKENRIHLAEEIYDKLKDIKGN